MQILPATIADLTQLVALENELFTSDRIPRRQFRYLLTKANAVTVKIEQKGKLAGYLVLLKRKNSRNLRIYSIAIRVAAQNQGLAKALVRYAEQVAQDNRYRSITLEVCEHNSSAVKLYRGAGFSQYGTKPGYYEDGCTALLLRKEIVNKDETP